MSLGLKVNVRIKIAVVLSLLLCSNSTVMFTWAAVSYSEIELKSVESQDEIKIRDLRNQEIKQLRIALGLRNPNKRKADLYFRLSELYVEAYRAAYLLEGRVHEKRIATGTVDKAVDHSRSQNYLKLAIKSCDELLKLGIAHAHMDQVYYFLGFNHAELGHTNESKKYFEILSKKYPNSDFSAESHRELGEMAFREGRYKTSIEELEAAIPHASASVVPRILHKLSWSYYRTRQYSQAVGTMKRAVEIAGKSGEKFLNIKEEALRDMAIFMTETGQVGEAIDYFNKVAGDKEFYPQILERLGKQYERNVEPVKATQVYEALLKARPGTDSAFRVLVKLVDLDLRQKKFKEALSRLVGLKIPSSSENETQVAVQNLRAMIRRTATEHHELYRKKKTHGTLEIAEAYYTAYLNQFLAVDDSRNETPEIQMYLAEAKAELGKSKEASGLYKKILESKDKRYSKEAGVLWTASLADTIKKNQQNVAGKNKSLQPSELEREFVSASDQLVENLPETQEAREASLKSAQVLAGYKGSENEALKRSRQLIARWSGTPQALTAARLMIQIYSDQGNYDDLKAAVQELRENKTLLATDHHAGGKLKILMNESELKLRIHRIGEYEKKKDFASAAQAYESLAVESPQQELAEKAYANAVAAYGKILDPNNAARVSQGWLKRYPKSKQALDSIRDSATQFLIQGEFNLSAKLFERSGMEGGDADSLNTAALIYRGIGENAQAQTIWNQYLQTYPKSDQKWGIALALARSFESTQRDSEAAKTYKYCMEAPSEIAVECAARLADLYTKNQSHVEARALLKKVAKEKSSKKGVASPFYAYIRYKLAEAVEKDVRFSPLELPEAHLKKALNQRLEFLEPLSRAYLSAVEVGGPWGIAALDQLANWVSRFADEVEKVTPQSGDSASMNKFRGEIKAISLQLRQKALTTWQDAYGKAVNLGILSPVIPGMADHLAELKVNLPARAQGPREELDLAGLAPDAGKEGFKKVREQLSTSALNASAWVDYGNLLWGSGQPLLAKLMYDRALSIQRKNAHALNNEAVLLVKTEGHEDWYAASQAASFLLEALKNDEFFTTAKSNLAILYNYYRLFSRARTLWTQVLVKSKTVESEEGMAVVYQGLGNNKEADAALARARSLGASSSRFVHLFFKTSKLLDDPVHGPNECLSLLRSAEISAFKGFEKESLENLKRTCELWKIE